MQPVIVWPVHDPEGHIFSHLERIAPLLRTLFGRVFLGITSPTREAHPRHIRRLEADDFFAVTFSPAGALIGDQFLALYTSAAAACAPGQILHLCFIDRVAFILQSQHQHAFVADVRAVTDQNTPLLFQRSEAAWATHPRTYREIEHMATRVGELLLGESLDFTWCHLAVQARQLLPILPHIKRRDLSMLAEILLMFRGEIHTRDVDWLAWEDPFMCARDAAQLKQEREQSIEETQKRLSYVVPTLQLLAGSVED
jgi:hypothetical protein